MLSTTRRRALAALAATTLAAGLAVAGAAPAQALAGSVVTLDNLTGVFTPTGAGRDLALSATLDVTDPASPGTIVFTIETITGCLIPVTTSQQTLSNIDHDDTYVFSVSVPASGIVRVSWETSDGLGGQTPLQGSYPFWEVSAIPGSVSATLAPNLTTEGTGVITFSVGTALAGYDLDIYVDGVFVASTNVGYCSTKDFGYSSFAAGQTIEVRNILTGSTALASFTIPQLPTPPAPGGNAPAANGGLAATGVDALPFLTIAALLLAAGAATVLIARRRRLVR